jgi:hypothetical protein
MESNAMRVAGEVLTDPVYALRRHNMQAYRSVMRVAESGLVEAYWEARRRFLRARRKFEGRGFDQPDLLVYSSRMLLAASDLRYAAKALLGNAKGVLEANIAVGRAPFDVPPPQRARA